MNLARIAHDLRFLGSAAETLADEIDKLAGVEPQVQKLDEPNYFVKVTPVSGDVSAEPANEDPEPSVKGPKPRRRRITNAQKKKLAKSWTYLVAYGMEGGKSRAIKNLATQLDLSEKQVSYFINREFPSERRGTKLRRR